MIPSARPYTTTAMPARRARALAFVAILVAGLSGGLIGWSFTDLQCGGPPGDRTEESRVDEGCTTWAAVGGLVGATVGAGGVGIVAVLVLRAMAEWRRTLDVEGPPPPPPPGGPATP
jgi:hypothetical protein